MKDFLFDSDEDLVIKNGDFVLSTDDESDRQNLFDIAIHSPGQIRGSIYTGAGLNGSLNSNKVSDITSRLREQYFRDNFRIYTLKEVVDPTEIVNLNVGSFTIDINNHLIVIDAKHK